MYDDTIATRDGKRFVSSEVNDHFSALCPTIVLDDRDDARPDRRARPAVLRRGDRALVRGRPATERGDRATGVDQLAEIEAAADRMVAYLHEAKIPVRPNTTATFNVDHGYGTYHDAIDYVERLADAGADEIMCLIQMGTVPQAVCLETIRQWGEHVIPHFRTKGT